MVRESVCTGAFPGVSYNGREGLIKGAWYMYLGNEAVWHWDSGDACEEGRAAEEEEVPVEACWFLEGELAGLGAETAYILDRWLAWNADETRMSRPTWS